MKNTVLAVMLAFGFAASAQVNQNVIRESTTTTVTVNNGSGKPKQVTKTQTTEAKQNIEFENPDSKKLNKKEINSPVQVTNSTNIKGDGIPTYYELNGEKYIFTTNKDGYQISSPSIREYGVVRKTANGEYIFRTKKGTSVGHFDEKGNFIVETYDDTSDSFIVETYTKTAGLHNNF